MKHSVFHRVISTILSLLVVFSTLSLTVEKHFCGDHLVDVAVFSKVKKCGVEDGAAKKPCCKDEVEIIDNLDDFATTDFQDSELKQQKFVIAFVASYQNLFEHLPRLVIPHNDYKPPNLHKDFQVLHETFLI